MSGIAAADWWVVVPPSEAGSSGVPGNAQIISTKPGSPADSTLMGGGTVVIAGKQWTRFLGPYPTKGQAQSAAPEGGLQYIGTLIGIGAGAADQGLTGAPGPAGVAAAGAAGGSAGSAAGSFFQNVPWLRIGEIALGLLLIAVGVAHLSSSVPAATAIAKKLGAVGLAA